MPHMNNFIKLKGAVIVTLLLILSLLTACGGGGTGYRSQVHHKSNNKHLKGWQKPYSINGRIYQPLLTAKGYNEKGVALIEDGPLNESDVNKLIDIGLKPYRLSI